MSRVRSVALLVFAACTLLSASVYAQNIEIKGLRLGMTKEEVEEKIGRLPVRDFTIAGVREEYGNFAPQFYDGKLDSLHFFFDSRRFDHVVSAVNEKYPSFACKDNAVTNAMGATFTQTRCTLRDELGNLHMSRFTSDIRRSVLNLQSDRRDKELMEKDNRLKKDI